MRKVARTGHVHCDASVFCGLNDFLVADGTTRLHDGTHSGVREDLESICEWEERVGGGDGTVGTVCLLYTSPSPRDS